MVTSPKGLGPDKDNNGVQQRIQGEINSVVGRRQPREVSI
jgi:hypothetical protein